jgi:hypothetical protein
VSSTNYFLFLLYLFNVKNIFIYFLNFEGMDKKAKEGIKVETNVASTSSQRRKGGKKN